MSHHLTMITAILTAEGNKVVLLDVTGRVLASYPFETMDVNKALTVDGGGRLLVVATLRSSPKGLVPRSPRVERCIAGQSFACHRSYGISDWVL